MGRWEPDALGRLRAAALDLFTERGYEQTTVADIAERAGLTSRTFFRYFPDKREVLFQGAEGLEGAMTEALKKVDSASPALEAVSAAVYAVGSYMGDIRDFARLRRNVIQTNAELRERELTKLSKLSGALAEALIRRGSNPIEAQLAAETGLVVFRISFELWIAEGELRSFRDIAHELFLQMSLLTRV